MTAPDHADRAVVLDLTLCDLAALLDDVGARLTFANPSDWGCHLRLGDGSGTTGHGRTQIEALIDALTLAFALGMLDTAAPEQAEVRS